MFSGRMPRVSAEHLVSGFHQLAVELVPEGLQQVGDGLLHADISPQLGTQRRHSFTHNAAGHNVAEPRHVGVAVQRQAVRGDVATAVDSYRDGKRV